MTYAGKALRLSRFFYRGSRCGLIVPIDHGLTIGPVHGLVSTARIGSWLTHSAVSGIIAHKGILERLAQRGLLSRLGVMLHLNGMSTLAASADTKEMLTSVDTALRLGADGVSLQINYEGSNDAHNLILLGRVVDEAHRYGLPVLTMLYDKVPSETSEGRLHRQRHLMRIAIELGSDALKIAPPESPEQTPLLLDGLSDDIPLFLAGGELRSDEQLITATKHAIQGGAAGLCIGRNIFQRQSADALLDQLSQMLRQHVQPHA